MWRRGLQGAFRNNTSQTRAGWGCGRVGLLLGCGGNDPPVGVAPGRNETSRALRRQSHARGSPPFTATAAGRASRLPHRWSRCQSVRGSGTGAESSPERPHVARFRSDGSPDPPDRPSFPRLTRAIPNARDMPRPIQERGTSKSPESARVRARASRRRALPELRNFRIAAGVSAEIPLGTGPGLPRPPALYLGERSPYGNRTAVRNAASTMSA